MKMYETTAHNHSHASENRIHADDVAQKYGFRGGLVPGVAVFGYMTHPLVTELGGGWLGHGILNVRFLKPAYDGDRLRMKLETRDGVHAVTCRNDRDELLAELSLTTPGTLPAPDARFRLPAPAAKPPRVEISTEAIDIGVPFTPFRQTPSAEDNRTYAERVNDDHELYRQGVLHPHLLQHWSNLALVQRFVMPAWIHVSSEMRFRKTLHVGDPVDIRAVPIEKWERRGHEFVKLYVAYVVNGEPATEVFHTAIYRVAPKAA
jgi:acyl dehydratase